MLLPLTISMDISGLSRKSAMNDDVEANKDLSYIMNKVIRFSTQAFDEC